MTTNMMRVLNKLLMNRLVLRGSQTLLHSRNAVGLVPRKWQQCSVVYQARFCSKQIQTKQDARYAIEDTADANKTSTKHVNTKAPTDFEKKIFVWVGKYPTVDAVPPFVTDAALKAAKDKLRVYVSIGMLAVTFFTALVMMYFGRRRARRGESLSGNNMKRHPKHYRDQLDSTK